MMSAPMGLHVPVTLPPAHPVGTLRLDIPFTYEDDCRLESGLVQHWGNKLNRLQMVANLFPTKTFEAVKRRVALLEMDISNIESGRVPLPSYPGSSEPLQLPPATKKKSSASAADERRKGVPWSEEEHRLFLQWFARVESPRPSYLPLVSNYVDLGLEIYGKGDWRSISRKCVLTRNPTQVASHAQKYFIRLNSLNKKDKRRSSIHDITTPAGGATAGSGAPAQQAQPAVHQHMGMAIPGQSLPPNMSRLPAH